MSVFLTVPNQDFRPGWHLSPTSSVRRGCGEFSDLNVSEGVGDMVRDNSIKIIDLF